MGKRERDGNIPLLDAGRHISSGTMWFYLQSYGCAQLQVLSAFCYILSSQQFCEVGTSISLIFADEITEAQTKLFVRGHLYLVSLHQIRLSLE